MTMVEHQNNRVLVMISVGVWQTSGRIGRDVSDTE